MTTYINPKLTYILATVATLYFVEPAFAVGEDIALANQNDSSATAQDVNVYSGGVAEEMDYIKSVEHQYDLKILFSEASGAFLADMPVTIADKQGKTVVSTVTKGPILLVNLPEGTYKLTAIDGTVSRDQTVTVAPNSLRSYQIRFPTAVSDLTQNSNQ